MTDNKWHLVSTFDRTQTLEEFCASINFKRDADENYIYRINDGIEAGEQVKKENWYRVTINDGDVATYNGTTWDQNIEKETALLPRTSYWIFGVEGDKIKGQWGSRGTGSGEMKIESILLSYIPYYPDENNFSLINRGENCDLYALVKFDNNRDTLSFQSMSVVQPHQSIIPFPSVSSSFKEFEAVFEKTKKKDGGVYFINFSNIYYRIIGPNQNGSSVGHSSELFHTIYRSSWISYLEGLDLYNDDKIGPFTDPKEAWNALFCFRKYYNQDYTNLVWELKEDPTSPDSGEGSYIDYAGRLSME